MKKLEDLPKKNIFQAPDGYFDQLPGIVQSKIAQKQKSKSQEAWGFALKYALPVVLLVGVGIFWYSNDKLGSAEEELALMSPDQLTLFLNDTDLSTEELIENVSWRDIDLEELEDEVYSNLEVTGNDMDSAIDELSSEL